MIRPASACSSEALALGRQVSGGEGCFPSCVKPHATPFEERTVEFEGMIGVGTWIRHLRNLIEKLAPLPSSVLVCGESGTGKELIARALHNRSGRDGQPFIGVNCSAIPESLLESELFGHEKGAFTGAVSASEGLWRAAGRGTLFLDEIGEMPVTLQAKLLRAIETREVQPVGSTSTRPVGARLIAATNTDIRAAVESGSFREDLYYRLSVVVVRVPPLRERREEIPALVNHFLQKFSALLGLPEAEVSIDAMRSLFEHCWPGNIRELANTLERAVIFAEDGLIRSFDLGESGCDSGHPESSPLDLRSATRRFEIEHINRVIGLCSGNKRRAARLLGLGPTSLYRKLGKRA